MKWFTAEQHARVVGEGERGGYCPGCGQPAEKFGSMFLPGEPLIGICCEGCIDGSAIVSVDPRQDPEVIREMLKGPSGEPPPIVVEAIRAASARSRRRPRRQR